MIPTTEETVTGKWARQQGRIHDNPVADGWAGAVMPIPLEVQKCDLPTDLPTDTARCRVALEMGKGKEGEKKRKKASKLQSPTGDCNF